MLGSRWATWLWLVVALVGLSWASSLAIEDEDTLALHSYTTLEFTTQDATKKSYTEFLESMRNKLASGYKRYGIRVLREWHRVADNERFLLVKLSNSPDTAITLALDVTTANVAAYQAGYESYFFNDTSNLAFSILFNGTYRKWLPFSGEYSQLEKAAAATRKVIDLGIFSLDRAITTLYVSHRTAEKSLASALIVVIQMITEAARFRYIEQRVRFNFKPGTTFRPDLGIIFLENNWVSLSIQIQESYQKVFSSAVMLRRGNGEIFYADSVSEILKGNLALLKFVCISTEPTSLSSSSSSSYLRQVAISGHDVTCPPLEPAARIAGRDSRCVVVQFERPLDGNPVILWDCGINHVWTFKRDGTVRWREMCLTTYNFGEESNIVVYNCSTAPKSTTLWEVKANGSIVNPVSGKSLTALLPNSDNNNILILEDTISASRQGWFPTNYTTPFRASIVGFNDLCLRLRGTNNLWLQDCANLGLGREWAFYADGTIRPVSALRRCLTCNSPFSGSDVIIMDCKPSGWALQRWMVNSDGTIMNPSSGLVLDVRRSNPDLQQMIIYPRHGGANQRWLPLL
ncbi:hypothetical protein Tsubulata_037681 [Turnera subulata]|uniref:Ribosome-inactivating protein n=1 Tax=Turnera subulata TaxID=218843 RepID=A0A9Q0JLL5_9ROSI|nr:hypothetical protein Tsubulata_037681 [Turnera subulata]KAJ4845191.1 hypothetical protein Tsubulata_037681 [Turnera subulata]